MVRNHSKILRKIRAMLGICILLFVLFSTGVLVFLCFDKEEPKGVQQVTTTTTAQTDYALSSKEDSTTTEENELFIRVLDVDHGLSVLIECGGASMLYDGGNYNISPTISEYLMQYGYGKEQSFPIATWDKRLDYMVCSHYDSDHCAGLCEILSSNAFLRPKHILAPAYECKDNTATYRKFLSLASDAVCPKQGDQFDLGGALVTVVSTGKEYEEENDNSLALMITLGAYRCFIGGDLTVTAEKDLLASGYLLPCDLYIVNHHGSASSSDEDFVRFLAPRIAIISDRRREDTNDTSNAASKRVLKLLESECGLCMETRDYGTILYCTNGKEAKVGYSLSPGAEVVWLE